MKSAKSTHTSVWNAQDTTESRVPRLNVHTNQIFDYTLPGCWCHNCASHACRYTRHAAEGFSTSVHLYLHRNLFSLYSRLAYNFEIKLTLIIQLRLITMIVVILGMLGCLTLFTGSFGTLPHLDPEGF